MVGFVLGFGSGDVAGGIMTLPSPNDVRALIPGPCGCSFPRQKDLETGRPSGGSQPNYMELFWLQKTRQVVHERLGCCFWL